MRYETSVVINRPIDQVWEFISDPFNVPRRGGGALSVRLTSPGPPGLGSTVQGRLVILGFETRISGTITEWDPPHAFTFSLTGAGTRSGSLRQTLEATADGTKVVRVTEGEARPAFKLLWWIVWPFMTRRSHIADQNMKRLLEAGRG